MSSSRTTGDTVFVLVNCNGHFTKFWSLGLTSWVLFSCANTHHPPHIKNSFSITECSKNMLRRTFRKESVNYILNQMESNLSSPENKRNRCYSRHWEILSLRSWVGLLSKFYGFYISLRYLSYFIYVLLWVSRELRNQGPIRGGNVKKILIQQLSTVYWTFIEVGRKF